jgi:hypothetical protein
VKKDTLTPLEIGLLSSVFASTEGTIAKKVDAVYAALPEVRRNLTRLLPKQFTIESIAVPVPSEEDFARAYLAHPFSLTPVAAGAIFKAWKPFLPNCPSNAIVLGRVLNRLIKSGSDLISMTFLRHGLKLYLFDHTAAERILAKAK